MSTKKGCLLGCGVTALVVVTAIIILFFYVRQQFIEIEEYTHSSDDLIEVFGTRDNFTPLNNGNLTVKNVKTYLAFRDSLENDRIEIMLKLETIDKLIRTEEEQGFSKAFGVVKTGFTLFQDIFKYVDKRSKLFISNNYSPYQYYYIYCLANFSYLKHKTSDGPLFKVEEGNIEVGSGEQTSTEQNLIERELMYNRSINILFRNYLKNLVNNEPPNKKVYEEELKHLQDNGVSIPFQKDLPDNLKMVFDSLKTELTADYDSLFNVVELQVLFDED